MKGLPCNANPLEVAMVFTQLGVNIFLEETQPNGIMLMPFFRRGGPGSPI